MIIKHILIRLNKANLITQEIIQQLKNIFKENLLVRTFNAEDNSNYDHDRMVCYRQTKPL